MSVKLNKYLRIFVQSTSAVNYGSKTLLTRNQSVMTPY